MDTKEQNEKTKSPEKTTNTYRADGWINVLNKYGTSKDSSEQYRFAPDGEIPDEVLILNYEQNGLFAKIIDTPAEEAVSHGFSLPGLSDKYLSFAMAALDELDFDLVAETCIKWARLFGGAVAVMLVNDGRGLEEPLDWDHIQSIDDIRVYDRSVIQPCWNTMYTNDPQYPFGSRGSRLGTPEIYRINSLYGSFLVHESRLLIFQNGELPELSTTSIYRNWGIPEYVRIHRAIRDADITHGSATKMLNRSVQPIYKLKDLASLLSSEEGESQILKRLQVIDMARGLLNSIVIDADGEDYDFRTFSYSGVADVVDSTCNFLSALTSIPQTILFGRSPAGMNATGESDFENYYNFVGQIQRRMLRGNLRYLLSVIFQAGVATGEIDRVPNINVVFNPLWSMSEKEKVESELQKAQAQAQKAMTILNAVNQKIISVQEAREQLVAQGVMDLHDDSKAIDECPQRGGASPAAPTATKLPQDMNDQELEEIEAIRKP